MATKHLMALALLAVLLGCASAAPRPRPRPKARGQNTFNQNNLNIRQYSNGYPGSAGLPPVVNSVIRSASASGAQLINVQPALPAISQRLPDNYTLIRPNTVDTFRCAGSEFPKGYRNYGYYADQDNECQLFHVCLPMQQLYPNNFTAPVTYQFSFICPEYTIFSQDAMVCAWTNEAVPCEYAAELYNVNEYFFSNTGIDGEVYGQKQVDIPRSQQPFNQQGSFNQQPFNQQGSFVQQPSNQQGSFVQQPLNFGTGGK